MNWGWVGLEMKSCVSGTRDGDVRHCCIPAIMYVQNEEGYHSKDEGILI